MAKTKLLAALGAAATMAAASAAQASTVTLTEQTPGDLFANLGWFETVTVSTDSGVSTQNFNAGAFELNDGMRDLLAFCLDPETFLNLGEDFDTMVTAAKWDTVLTEIDKLFTSSYSLVNSAETAAGFQIALWEIIIDQGGTMDITDGIFRASASVGAEAFANMALMALASAGTGGFNFTTYVNSGQDLINAEAVPVPAAVLLMAPVLGGLAMRKRRKA
ncbi:MAG: VPLPA-CTERM sorting domain-containing protein [Pseudomonadota bacterium]